MPTELITFKADREFIKKVDQAAKAQGYHSRTEFIREALRDKIEPEEIKELREKIEHMRKSLKRAPITDEEYERVREQVAHDMMNEPEEERRRKWEDVIRDIKQRSKEKNKG